MDPVSAVGVAAGTAQFVDIGGRALVGALKLLRELRDTPKWICQLSEDLEKSFQRIRTLQQLIEQLELEESGRPSQAQVKAASDAVKDAYEATTNLKKTLDPYAQDPDSSTQKRWRKTWKAMISVTERSNIEQQIQQVLFLNHEVSRALQVIQFESQKAMV